MKKAAIFIAILCGILVFVSCNKDNPTGKTYLKYVLEDYKTLVKAYPEAKDHFVEARFTLAGNISEGTAAGTTAEGVEIYCYVWLNGQSVISVIARDFTTGKTETVQYFADSPWLGDMTINESELKSLGVSLERALANARKDSEASAGDGLDTRYVTLRKPLWPVWDNPQYVIGGSSSRKDHVFVDAKNGKVTVKQNQPDQDMVKALLVGDYGMMIDMFGNEEANPRLDMQRHLAEVRFVLNAPLNAKQSEDLFAKEVTYIFCAPVSDVSNPDTYTVQGVRDLTAGLAGELKTSSVKTGAVWTDRFIGPEFFDDMIDLEQAIYNVKLANVKDTDTDEVTIRWPGGFENPQYIFRGSTVPSVYVDGLTGEVAQ